MSLRLLRLVGRRIVRLRRMDIVGVGGLLNGGRREWDRSRSLSARAWTTRIGELAGRRVYRWSEHTAALVDHATGVGSGGYTT